MWAKVSYWWFIIMLFLIGLFSGNLDVYAETGSYNSSTYAYYTTSCNNQLENCSLSGPSTFTSMGTISHPSGSKIGGIAFRAYLSSGYYNSGNSYTFKWRVCESTKWTNDDSLLTLKNNARIMRVDYNTSNSATNATEGDTSVVGLVISDDASSNYCWYAQFTYTPTTNIRYIGFYMSTIGFTDIEQTSGSHNGLSYYGLTTGNDFRTNGLTITYTTDATSTAINNQTTIISNEINNVNDNITSDDVDDPSDTFDELNDMLPQNGVITQLITLPITLYQKVLNSLSGTCQSFDLGELYNTHLIMPCINPGQYLGNTLWGIIDTILSGMLVWSIAKTMIKAFNNFTSLKEGDVVD